MELVLALIGIAILIGLVYLTFYLIKKIIIYRTPAAIISTIISIIALVYAFIINSKESITADMVIPLTILTALPIVVIKGHVTSLNKESDKITISEIKSLLITAIISSIITGVIYFIIGFGAEMRWVFFVGPIVAIVLIAKQFYIDFLKKDE